MDPYQQQQQLDRLKSIVTRIAALEMACCPTSVNDKSSDVSSLEKRMEQVEQKIKSRQNSRVAEWVECERLFKELAPSLTSMAMAMGTLSTDESSKNNTKNAPITYRRQEILACVDEFKRNISCLQQIHGIAFPLDQILSGQSDALNVGDQELKRIEVLEQNLKSISQQAYNISNRVDTLLNMYHDVIMSASEKIVLYDEELRDIVSKQTH